MSETFLTLSATTEHSIKTDKNTKHVSNSISQNNNTIFEIDNNKKQTQAFVDDSIVEEINNAKEQQEYEFYDIQNEKFAPSVILDEYEITKDDLKYATGEQLLGLYFETTYGEDSDYLEHNAMLMTLLSDASSEQIKDFMDLFDELTKNEDVWDENYNFSYDNLGKQLLYASRAEEIIGKDTCDKFFETVSKYPELFPKYNEYVGISCGNQL